MTILIIRFLYASFLYDFVMKSVESYNRCDIVTDRYFSESLKEEVPESTGSHALRVLFKDFTSFPA